MVDLLIRDANNYDRTDQSLSVPAGLRHLRRPRLGVRARGVRGRQQPGVLVGGDEFRECADPVGTGDRQHRRPGRRASSSTPRRPKRSQQYWFDVDGIDLPRRLAALRGRHGLGRRRVLRHLVQPGPGEDPGHQHAADHRRPPVSGVPPGIREEELPGDRRPAAPGAPREWQDIIWSFLATGDPDAALARYRANNSFVPEEGESRAHTFHWIRNLAALGVVDTSVTADNPLAVTFVKNGARTYVAANVTAQPLTVTFSTGVRLVVAPGKTATAGALTWSGGAGPGGGGRRRQHRRRVSADGGVADGACRRRWCRRRRCRRPWCRRQANRQATFSPLRYLGAAGSLTDRAGTGRAVVLHSADGATHDGTPYQSSVFTATGLTATVPGWADRRSRWRLIPARRSAMPRRSASPTT